MSRGAGTFDAAILRLCRQDRGLSRAELAAAVHTSSRQIAAYESGRQIPEPARLLALAAALDIPPSHLAGTAFGSRSVADLRRAAGLTVSQAAKAAGISTTTYRKIEHDGIWSRNNSDLLDRLAVVLNCQARVLIRALENSSAHRRRSAQAESVLSELVDQAVDITTSCSLKRGDPRVRLVADTVGWPTDDVRHAVNAILSDVRRAAREVAMLEVVMEWEDSGGVISASTRYFSMRGRLDRLTYKPLDKVTSLLHDLLPGTEWAAMVEIWGTGAVEYGSATEHVLRSLASKGYIQIDAQPGDDPTGALAVSLTDAGREYFTLQRALRHERVHPHVPARGVVATLAASRREKENARLRNSNLLDMETRAARRRQAAQQMDPLFPSPSADLR